MSTVNIPNRSFGNVMAEQIPAGADVTDSKLTRLQNTQSSTQVQASATGKPDQISFFALFDEIWSKLLMLAKQLRDTMQFYNQKKQELGWGLEVNTLQQSFKAIDHSYDAAVFGAVGSIFAGLLTLGSGAAGAKIGGVGGFEAGMSIGGAVGQVASGTSNALSGNATRRADADKAIADLQNKGAQSYVKTLDDTLMKAREIMQQMMDMGRNLVEVFSHVLRAISR